MVPPSLSRVARHAVSHGSNAQPRLCSSTLPCLLATMHVHLCSAACHRVGPRLARGTVLTRRRTSSATTSTAHTRAAQSKEGGPAMVAAYYTTSIGARTHASIFLPLLSSRHRLLHVPQRSLRWLTSSHTDKLMREWVEDLAMMREWAEGMAT